ncbi:MAG: CopL family metal-binding regulatory protein [Proteobacteria bacterium]|nr:CopL family metal-binding regulatory protein [Pseudomonadota bacterium]
MPIHADLLRILLSLALVLNGLGSAAASVQMTGHMMQAPVKATPSITHQSDQASCDHQHPAATDNAYPASHQVHAKHGDPASPDCCKSSTCSCACVHACTSVTMAAQQVLLIPAHDPGTGRIAVTYPSPALPHLIRPPIG